MKLMHKWEKKHPRRIKRHRARGGNGEMCCGRKTPSVRAILTLRFGRKVRFGWQVLVHRYLNKAETTQCFGMDWAWRAVELIRLWLSSTECEAS